MVDKTLIAFSADGGGSAALQVVELSNGHALAVSEQGRLVDVILTPGVSPMADGDVLAATQEVTDFFGAAGGTRRLVSVRVNDKDAQGEPFDLLLLQSNVSVGSENSPVSLTDGNADAILGQVRVQAADFADYTACKVAIIDGLDILLGAGATTSLFIAAVSRGIGTYTASGITLRLGVL